MDWGVNSAVSLWCHFNHAAVCYSLCVCVCFLCIYCVAASLNERWCKPINCKFLMTFRWEDDVLKGSETLCGKDLKLLFCKYQLCDTSAQSEVLELWHSRGRRFERQMKIFHLIYRYCSCPVGLTLFVVMFFLILTPKQKFVHHQFWWSFYLMFDCWGFTKCPKRLWRICGQYYYYYYYY